MGTRMLVTGGISHTSRADKEAVEETLDGIHASEFGPIEALLEGNCPGIDRFARHWARDRGVSVETYRVNWRLHGKDAVKKLNEEMIAKADWVVAFWDGSSSGTGHAIESAKRHGKLLDVRILRVGA